MFFHHGKISKISKKIIMEMPIFKIVMKIEKITINLLMNFNFDAPS